METKNEEGEMILNVRFVKGSKPILIDDEENKVRDNYLLYNNTIFEKLNYYKL